MLQAKLRLEVHYLSVLARENSINTSLNIVLLHD
nr:MAG TPA: hypothetical protein [Caudoviricetes sp.]